MQPLARDGLTAAQVERLLRDAPAVTIGRGCELVGRDLAVIEDISADFIGGTISRSSYDTLHASGSFEMSRDLDWGADIIRPYMTVSDGTTTARFNLGVYWPQSPRRNLLYSPGIRPVTGYDILLALQDPVGASYAVTAGTAYLSAVEAVLVARGFPAGSYIIDQTRADAVLPSDRVWVLDESTTWLSIVNDLLGALGYAGIWSDWDGRLRAAPYVSPTDRAAEWVYDTSAETSMVEPDGEYLEDYFGVPNRWVFVRSNNTEGPTPVEGDGIYTYVNQSTGPASVDARRGMVLTKPPAFVDAADQTALERLARITIDADMRIPRALSVSTFPNPLHWHFDRVVYDDPRSVRMADVLCTAWSLPLDGGRMSHDWSLIS